MIFGVAFYLFELVSYLEKLFNPKPLYYGFCVSVLISWFYDFKSGFIRLNTLKAASTIIGFCIGLILAINFRPVYESFYLALQGDEKMFKEIVEIYGVSEYVEAFKNKAVGYGACFALGMAISRVFIQKHIERAIFYFLAIESDLEERCPTCDQLLKPDE